MRTFFRKLEDNKSGALIRKVRSCASSMWELATEETDTTGVLVNPWVGHRVKPHHLRHANASWLLANGVDLVTVKERPRHSNITVTSRCLRALPGAQEEALAALDTALGR